MFQDGAQGGVVQLKPDIVIRPYVQVLAPLFAAAFLLGMFAPFPAKKEVADIVSLLADQFPGLAGGTLFLVILLNNLMATLLVLSLGLLLGIVPVLSVVVNGFVLGAVYRQVSGIVGYGEAAMKVVPHGIFEIPALLFSASYGLWLGMRVLRRLRGKSGDPLGGPVRHAVRRYFVVVFPLLIAAAAIETFLILRSQ